jgi:hypothetical protein
MSGTGAARPAEPTHRASAGALWTGFLLPPAAWLTDLGLSYAMVPFRHGGGTLAGRLAVAAVTLAAAVAGTLLSLRNLRRLGRAAAVDTPGRFFLAGLGIVGGVYFALVVVAQTIPNLMLRPWDQL